MKNEIEIICPCCGETLIIAYQESVIVTPEEAIAASDDAPVGYEFGIVKGGEENDGLRED